VQGCTLPLRERVGIMLGLARFLKIPGGITEPLNRGAGRRPVRRATLDAEELENRVVPTLLGQQLFPPDNAWNQNVSAAPVDPNSPAMIALIGASTRVTPDWGANPNNLFTQQKLYGIPVNVVHGNSVHVTLTNVIIDNYPGQSEIVPVPIPNTYAPVLEGDLPNGPNNNGPGYGENGTQNQRGDSHLIVWDEDNNVAYELFGTSRPSDPNLFPNTNSVELSNPGGWHAAQETVFDMKTDTFRTIGATSADAAGLSILAGLARPDEGLPVSQGGTGVIDHALRVTLNGYQVAPRKFTYPASHMITGQLGTIPLGARLRLVNTPAVNQLIGQMGPEAQILAHAMQQYGLIVADVGSPMYITGTDQFVDNVDPGVNPLTWDEKDIFGYLTGHPAGLESLNAGDFEFVDLTPVVTGLSATTGLAGTTLTITGRNFSGAAGRLSVLFGGSNASSVTLVDDTHLTAVVPNGSGTVDVQVQSGINEVDQIDQPLNPNVAETIASGYQTSTLFGYGISAQSSADLFTYSGQTISGANSTVSFADPTVASGNTDTVTIVVEDNTGAAVPGLASAAFGFSLSGGSSTGSFGAVTATGTPGTYTATFTGTMAGTTNTLTASVTGVALTGKPTITVTPGAVSSTDSTAGFATPTVASGGTDTVTVVVKDAAGNAVPGLTSGAFGFSLSGGTSTGSFGAVTESATPGTYTATFTGITAGTASTLTVTVSGIILNPMPTITITGGTVPSQPPVQPAAGGTSGTNSTASFATPTVALVVKKRGRGRKQRPRILAGEDMLTIAVKDGAGNPMAGLTNNAFGLGLVGGSSAGIFGPVTETAMKGTYLAMFTAKRAGTACHLTATVNGVALSSTPAVTVITSRKRRPLHPRTNHG
jgi:hypothetical protein